MYMNERICAGTMSSNSKSHAISEHATLLIASCRLRTSLSCEINRSSSSSSSSICCRILSSKSKGVDEAYVSVRSNRNRPRRTFLSDRVGTENKRSSKNSSSSGRNRILLEDKNCVIFNFALLPYLHFTSPHFSFSLNLYDLLPKDLLSFPCLLLSSLMF